MDVKATRTDPTFTLTMTIDEARQMMQTLLFAEKHFADPSELRMFATTTFNALTGEMAAAGVL